MSHHKKFGIWMDTRQATIVGPLSTDSNDMAILAHIEAEEITTHDNERNINNSDRNVTAKYFKDIAKHLTNATHVHVTGTGQIQEQFCHFLSDTPAFKNAETTDSTATKMSDDQLLKFLQEQL